MSEDSPPYPVDPLIALRAAFPPDANKMHAIISGQLAQIAALQAELRDLGLQRDAWRTLAAVRQGWAPLQAPAARFGALCVAFAGVGLDYAQQAAIVAGLMDEGTL